MRSLKAALTVALVLAAIVGSPALGATPGPFLSIAHGRAILDAEGTQGSPALYYTVKDCTPRRRCCCSRSALRTTR